MKIDVTQKSLFLGKTGTNLQRSFVFDFDEDFSDFAVTVLHQRYGDVMPYEVASVDRDGKKVIWNVTATDVDKVGGGELEIQFRNAEGVIVKTATFQTKTVKALGESSDAPPEPFEAWYDRMVAVSVLARQAADNARNSAISASASETNARNNANTAFEYAAQSKTNALNAKESEANASKSADLAQTAKAGAEIKAAEARASAQSAGAAKNAAETAAAGARESATTASAKADEAKDAAVRSAASARAASESAQTAATAKGEVVQAKTEALGAISTSKVQALADINTAKTTALTDITDKTEEQLARIPEVTALAGEVGNLKQDFNNIKVYGLYVKDGTLYSGYPEEEV